LTTQLPASPVHIPDAQGIHVLVIDDERNIRDVIARGLSRTGFTVTTAANGLEALSMVRVKKPDVILLDLMMPVVDGMTVLPELRRICEAPILIISAKGQLHDKIAGLDSGADHYINKPFEIDELIARIRSALRRPALAHVQTLRFEDLFVDLDTRLVRRGDRTIKLSRREFDLLAALIRRPRQVFTKERLLDLVWGIDREISTQTVETYICYLRQKIDDDFSTKLIHTIRGVGYSIREQILAG
jgi:DNA-binding response OmpR family regulator